MKSGEMPELSQHSPARGRTDAPGHQGFWQLSGPEAGMQCFVPSSLGSLMISSGCQHSHPILCQPVLVNFFLFLVTSYTRASPP